MSIVRIHENQVKLNEDIVRRSYGASSPTIGFLLSNLKSYQEHHKMSLLTHHIKSCHLFAILLFTTLNIDRNQKPPYIATIPHQQIILFKSHFTKTEIKSHLKTLK